MTAAGLVRRLGVIALAGAIAALAGGAKEAHAAGLGCGYNGELTRPFLPWLDAIRYELVRGGDFESALDGWQLTGGARVVEGNESFNVRGSGDRLSLLLPPGSTATTPPICVGVDGSVLRFFAQGGGGLFSGLRVQIMYYSAAGLQLVHDTLPVLPSSSWRPTLPLPVLANLTGLLSLNGITTEIRLRFIPVGSRSFQIDDLYVDPWFEE